MDDILQASGVAKSNFYYHFRTKDELALAVLGAQFADYESGILNALTDISRDPSGRLGRFCECLVTTQMEIQGMGGCPFGNFAAALSSSDPDEKTKEFRQILSRLFHKVEQALEECLIEGISAGHFRNDVPPKQLAMTMQAAVEGLMLMAKTHRDTMPLRLGLAVIQQLIRIPVNAEDDDFC